MNVTISTIWSKMVYAAENVFDLVKSYLKALIDDPKTFVSEHTIVTILIALVVILILVLFINICRNIKELNIEKKRISQELRNSMNSIDKGPDNSLDSVDRSATAFYEALEKKIQNEVEKETQKVKEEPIKEAPKVETPLERPTYVEQPKPVYVEQPKTVYVEQPRPVFVEPAKAVYVDPYSQYREYVKEPIQIEVVKPIPVQEPLQAKPVVPETKEAPVEQNIVEEKAEFNYLDALKNREPIVSQEVEEDNGDMPFGFIPELQVLERENTSSIEEIIKSDSEPIVMEKIEVVKVNPAKKYGVDNMDTNRQGKTFSYDELSELIKD